MEWSHLRKFKNSFHLAEKAVGEITEANLSCKLSYHKDKGLSSSLTLPPEKQIILFATVLRPLVDPSSPLYFKNIAQMLVEENLISDSDREILDREITKAESGAMLLRFNDNSLSAKDIYKTYSDGEFFVEIEPFASQIKEMKKTPMLMQMMLFQF